MIERLAFFSDLSYNIATVKAGVILPLNTFKQRLILMAKTFLRRKKFSSIFCLGFPWAGTVFLSAYLKLFAIGKELFL